MRRTIIIIQVRKSFKKRRDGEEKWKVTFCVCDWSATRRQTWEMLSITWLCKPPAKHLINKCRTTRDLARLEQIAGWLVLPEFTWLKEERDIFTSFSQILCGVKWCTDCYRSRIIPRFCSHLNTFFNNRIPLSQDSAIVGFFHQIISNFINVRACLEKNSDRMRLVSFIYYLLRNETLKREKCEGRQFNKSLSRPQSKTSSATMEAMYFHLNNTLRRLRRRHRKKFRLISLLHIDP